MVHREGRVDQRELKGVGDSITWCERSMEISVNEIHTLELLCMSSFETMTFKGPDGSLRNTQYLYHSDVPSEII